jgi:starch synthase
MYNYDLPDPRQTPKWSLCDLGLRDNAYYELYKWVFPPEARGDQGVVDDGECAKLLLGAMRMADRVVTVSPAYREEVMTDAGGWGLQHDARAAAGRFDGVLNGIDPDEWDPARDPRLAAPILACDPGPGKAACKAALQAALGLRAAPEAPLVCFVGRLAAQKGVDVLGEVVDWLMGDDGGRGVLGDVQLVMMGAGEERYAGLLRGAEARYKGRAVGYVGFTAALEHQIIAGADVLVMPSRYEPCGLPQVPRCGPCTGSVRIVYRRCLSYCSRPSYPAPGPPGASLSPACSAGEA